MNLRRLEELALNAWPAERQQLLDGWLLRCSGGYTKRANSVTPLYDSALDPEAKIAACEQFYARQQLPCTFRLPSFGPPELDRLLEGRGYRRIDPTLVLTRELDAASATAPSDADIRVAPLDRWLEAYSALDGASPAQRSVHRAILERIAAEPIHLLLHHKGVTVACGMGVLDGERFGLFDIVVAAERRGQGFGRRIVRALLSWAAGRGAREAYLQVVAANAPARRLYGGLGFAERYHYWYRQAPF